MTCVVACWLGGLRAFLLVELDSLLDLELCLSWTRVYLLMDDVEITFEDGCMDLSCCVTLSCPNETKEREKRDRWRRLVTQGRV